MKKVPMMVAATGLLVALSACGSTDTTRTATGAGTGAVAGAVVGGPVGAVVGGVGGAAAGASLDEGVEKKVQDLGNSGSTADADRTRSRTAQRSETGQPAMSSERIRQVQQALNDNGSGNDIAVDGVWGPNTRRALLQFQRDNDLRATGRLDDRTVTALNLDGTRTGTSGTTGTGTGTQGSGQNNATTGNTTGGNTTGGNTNGGTTGNTTGGQQQQ